MYSSIQLRQVARACFVAMFLCALAANAQDPQPQASPSSTQIVFLGTGMPFADPDRFGPATAIVVNDAAYLVDFGPGVVRRANAAAIDRSIKALEPRNLKIAFVTHLHSDHTAGYADLILSAWVLGRTAPLEVYGPKGIKNMTDHILAAYQEDIKIRTEGLEHESPDGWKVNAHEIHPGVVYKDTNVTVTAFPTKHGAWPETFGYRFDTADRSVVISGDTTPVQATIDACHGCDVLIHEGTPVSVRAKASPARQEYSKHYHTSSVELAQLAAKAKPGLLIVYHTLVGARPGVFPGAINIAQYLNEMRPYYTGQIAVARDLDIY